MPDPAADSNVFGSAPIAPTRGAEVVTWPDQADRVQFLRREGVPRLIVLDRGVAPPPRYDDLEDWLWLPASERDLAARLDRLAARGAGPASLDEVSVDDQGVIRVGVNQLALPSVEADLVRLLLARPIRVRSRDELSRAAWGESPRAGRSLDSRMLPLRRRLEPLGLSISAVRGQGFVIDWTINAAPKRASVWLR